MNQASHLQVKQFKHDIQSPIAALKTIVKSNESWNNSQQKVVDLTIQRIDELVKSLQSPEECYSQSNIYTTLKEIIKEKETTHSIKRCRFIIKFDAQAKSALCDVQPIELKRLLSNILNNSLEAIEEDGLIKIKAHINDKALCLSIIDNGHGISKEYINQITNLGWSHRKTNGQGLGLFHAKKTIEKWKGNLKINSVFNLGTKIILNLPIGQTRLSIAA